LRKVSRREFLKIGLATAGVAVLAGAEYITHQFSKPKQLPSITPSKAYTAELDQIPLDTAGAEMPFTPDMLPDATWPLDLNRQTEFIVFAMNLYAEALPARNIRTFSEFGQRAVEAIAQVVLNRTKYYNVNSTTRKLFGATTKETILKPGQFSWTNPSGSVYKAAFYPRGDPPDSEQEAWWRVCLEIADAALNGRMANPGVDNADHYFNPAKTLPEWADETKFIAMLGAHRFYRLYCPPSS
jgi:Cell Wall Hydrolase